MKYTKVTPKNLKVGDSVWFERTMEHGTVGSIDTQSDKFIVQWSNGYPSTERISNQQNGLLFEDTKENLEDVIEEYIKSICNKHEPEDTDDAVNPKHYDLFPEHGIQVRELMQVLCEKLDNKGYSGFLVSDYVQAMQYFLRWFDKGKEDDIKKGIWYMDKILKQLDQIKQG